MSSESPKVARVDAPVAKPAKLAPAIVATTDDKDVAAPYFTEESVKGWASLGLIMIRSTPALTNSSTCARCLRVSF